MMPLSTLLVQTIAWWTSKPSRKSGNHLRNYSGSPTEHTEEQDSWRSAVPLRHGTGRWQTTVKWTSSGPAFSTVVLRFFSHCAHLGFYPGKLPVLDTGSSNGFVWVISRGLTFFPTTRWFSWESAHLQITKPHLRIRRHCGGMSIVSMKRNSMKALQMKTLREQKIFLCGHRSHYSCIQRFNGEDLLLPWKEASLVMDTRDKFLEKEICWYPPVDHLHN